jgi:hypothetical protein
MIQHSLKYTEEHAQSRDQPPLEFLRANDDEKKIGHQGNAGNEDDDFSHLSQPPAEMRIYQADRKKDGDRKREDQISHGRLFPLQFYRPWEE